MMTQEQHIAPPPCATCPVHSAGYLEKLGVDMLKWDYVVALAGNPNTGKSTVFNGLTGLRQHTGNWPGKTVSRAEGGFSYGGSRFKLIDLPGAYSLLSVSTDEDIARSFIVFGRPDVTVVVVDATRLQRNLNLALQILEITGRVVVCLNLMDEAKRKHLDIDVRGLSRELGVPVVATSARSGEGLDQLVQTIHDVAAGPPERPHYRIAAESPELTPAIDYLTDGLTEAVPNLPNARWAAVRLLDGDQRIAEALQNDELIPGETPLRFDPDKSGRSFEGQAPGTPGTSGTSGTSLAIRAIIDEARLVRRNLSLDFHDQCAEAAFAEAARIADRVVTGPGEDEQYSLERAIDRVVTSRIWGLPFMLLLFALVFWITVSGANVPSGWLFALLIDGLYPKLHEAAAFIGFPAWLSGLTIDGMYLATAWVISVMLPPMAIFFPLFTLLEDFGYLPRVAFNLDHLFKKSGAHGKQALTMMMGFGCNAAGVIATRIIESPRERLIAIITNNFALCNGRWPTQIILAVVFVGALVPGYLAGPVAAAVVVGVALLGVMLTFLVSWFLSRTLLQGELSTFSLELPPYRRPRILRTIYTSLIDRTIFVLWRAIIFALPAGAAIWLSANIEIAGLSIAEHLIDFLGPFGVLIGLNGVIILAYIIAIPANEIVLPTILMLTVLTAGLEAVGASAGAAAGAGILFEPDSASQLGPFLEAGGWTLLTAVNMMLFSLVHNPCSTTIYTIYKETRSAKWTTVAALLPVILGLFMTFVVAQIWRLIA